MTGFNSDNSMQNLNMGLYMAQMGGLNKLQMPLASSLDYNLFSAYPMGMNLGGQIDMSNATIFNNPFAMSGLSSMGGLYNMNSMPMTMMPAFNFSPMALQGFNPFGQGFSMSSGKSRYNFSDVNFSLTNKNQKELNNIKTIYAKNKAKYKEVEAATGVPAELICAIHYREGGCKFNTYLHNGEKLGHVTKQVPKGKYFTDWTEAAIDALKDNNPSKYNFNKRDDLLEFAERYNGLGYRKRGLQSPYVWAGTDRYSGGMFVSDGVYNASARDNRVGVAAIVKSLTA